MLSIPSTNITVSQIMILFSQPYLSSETTGALTCNLLLHRTLYHVLSWYRVSLRTWCHTSESIFLNGHFNSLSVGVSSEGQCMVGGLEGNLTSWGWEVCFSLGSITLRTFIKVSLSQLIHLWNGMKKYTFGKKISKNFLAQGSISFSA